jgi:uncharacterized protein (DUF1501 family)
VIAPKLPYAGAQVWSADFLPACHQGVRIEPGPDPLPDVKRRARTGALERLALSLLERQNRRHAAERGDSSELLARSRSFETAALMQEAAPAVFDLSRESDATLRLYGLERGKQDGFAWQCLVARRLIERGVRFVEVMDVGASDNWDAHGDMASHGPLARRIDLPIAGLLTDLKALGLLSDTLLVWTTEFGRTPFTEKQGEKGRGHHAQAFSVWLAGGGVKGGTVHGETDDIGLSVVKDRVHLHDFHATILHLLGLDHERLTYRHSGRDFRLTDVSGKVVKQILA